MALASRDGFLKVLMLVGICRPDALYAEELDIKPRQLYTSSFTAEQPSAALESGNSMPFAPAPTSTEFASESADIVQGLVQGFFNKQKLEQGELECLSRSSGEVAGDFAQATSNAVLMFDQATGQSVVKKKSTSVASSRLDDGAGDIEAKIDAMTRGNSASSPGGSFPAGVGPHSEAVDKEEDRKHHEAQQSLDFFYGNAGRRLESTFNPKLMAMAPSMFMQAGMSMKKITSLLQQTAKDCLHHDALVALDKAATHMQSIEYVSGHLVANGQDVLTEMADAVEAYKEKDYHKFGADFGTGLRKVFLSNEGGNQLPDGLPGKYVISNVTEGFMKGMFGRGSEFDLKLPGDINQAPQKLNIDMHECVSDNLDFFQSVWSEMMFFYAKHDKIASSDDKVSWSTAVAFTMMNVPDAMDKCSLGPEQQQMIKDAAQAFADGKGGLGYKFKASKYSKVSKSTMERHMALTVKDWAKMRWSDFGEDMGHLMQEVAVTAFDQKYAIRSGMLVQLPIGGLAQRTDLTVMVECVVACAVASMFFLPIVRFARGRITQRPELYAGSANSHESQRQNFMYGPV